MTRPQSVWTVGAELGEGPVWVERDLALWFVDIKRRKIHRFDPEGGESRSWDSPEQIGFLLPAESGFIAGLESGLHRFDEESGEFALIAAVEADRPGNRINDGVVDAAGRLWFGTMDNDEKEPTGRFYRFQSGQLADAGLPPVVITNGPAISSDGRTLYHVDTLAGLIHACDLRADGSLGETRPFVRIAPEDGYPDGPTVDAEGCLWIGLYFGWEARRYSPRGELLNRVSFPTSNITKLAFGGSDGRTAYATTARQGLKPDQLDEQPEAGSLFAFRVDVPGIASPLVRL
ncbi:MAG TPA: SMP-30/gluconolactonase/LRE family protein [Allosphingosinicella sp.]|nr:SMP-30/gluconolactonase/LRE family protein [Allosphingosinicella sp.]